MGFLISEELINRRLDIIIDRFDCRSGANLTDQISSRVKSRLDVGAETGRLNPGAGETVVF